MNDTAKIILGLIVAVLVVWGGYSIYNKQTTKPTATEPIKIGIVAPLTGNAAFLGEGLKNAVLMSKEDYGETKYKYEIIFEDDQLSPKMSTSAANKLIYVDKVNAIISITAGTGNVIAPLAEQNEILHFGIANDLNIASGIYNFLHAIPPSKSARMFVKELENREIKKIAVFELNQEGVLALRKALDESLKGTDIEIVFEGAFNSGDRDFKSSVAIAKQAKPDIYVLLFFSPELEILAKQIKEMGIDTPMTAIQSFDLTQERDLFEGYWYVSLSEPGEDFIDRFEKKYGSVPAAGSANAYDIFSLIIRETENMSIKEKLINSDLVKSIMDVESFNGILGNTIINNEGVIIFAPAVKMIKDGKSITISE